MEYAQIVIPDLISGAKITYTIFFFTLIFSVPLGLILAIFGLSRFRLLKAAIVAYIWLFRGTPLLLQIFFVWFWLLPYMGVSANRLVAVILTFSLNYAAYFAEIFRGGIQSIDRGQYEGCHVLGFTYPQTMRLVILPQVVKRVLPPVGNEVITLVKDTALAFAIGVRDLIRVAQTTASRDFRVDVYLYAVVFYLASTLILTWLLKKAEQRFAYYE
ncbi:MAG: amino acid ABC transporter permease [Gracilibacteraceae bacterium]|jgi:polar amino acid transport system permease protein|nr:amino acid ABC transporter permease [Gracilibacteraceae bacterium]